MSDIAKAKAIEKMKNTEDEWKSFPAPRLELFSETVKTIIRTGDKRNFKSLLQTKKPNMADITITKKENISIENVWPNNTKKATKNG